MTIEVVFFFQDKQKFLVCQKQMLSGLYDAMATFADQNPSVNMQDFEGQIQDQKRKIDELLRRYVWPWDPRLCYGHCYIICFLVTHYEPLSR